ncbi:MAG TPA: polyprenol monophosphomannose synthase [Chloroflexi bacterium]|nr:polyprenol monophosphomannose synthase [Chloroflexota bacterium]
MLGWLNLPSQHWLKMQLTVITPTYNERENLIKLGEALFALPLPDLKLIVVDDNSPDGTGEAADNLVERYPGRVVVLHRKGKLGFGSAYIQGFQRALADGAEIVGQMDADFSHPPEKILEMLLALEKYDIVVGSRYIFGGGLDQDWPIWRKGLSHFANNYARVILQLPIRDVTGGFRLWRRNALESIPIDRIRSNGYSFLVELAYVAHRLGFTIGEVPIYFAERHWGDSKMSFRIQAEAAFRVWQLLWEYRDLEKI